MHCFASSYSLGLPGWFNDITVLKLLAQCLAWNKICYFINMNNENEKDLKWSCILCLANFFFKSNDDLTTHTSDFPFYTLGNRPLLWSLKTAGLVWKRPGVWQSPMGASDAHVSPGVAPARCHPQSLLSALSPPFADFSLRLLVFSLLCFIYLFCGMRQSIHLKRKLQAQLNVAHPPSPSPFSWRLLVCYLIATFYQRLVCSLKSSPSLNCPLLL